MKLKSLYTMLFLLLLTLAGCSAKPKSLLPIVETKPVTSVKEPAGSINRDTWTMQIPADWLVKETASDELVTRSFVDVGARPIIMVVNTITYDVNELKDEEFGDVAILVASRGENSEVLSAKHTLIDKKPATLALLAFPHNGFVMQYAVGHKHTGYILSCGGDIKESSTIASECNKIVKTFHFKDVK